MDLTFWVLVVLTLLAAVLALRKDRSLPLQGLATTLRMLRNVGPELALGFLLAGLLDVLIPAPVLASLLGGERLGRGILLGWGAGLLLPGGPYVVFPIIGRLLDKGAGAGPLIALITAKTLISPIRMLTYEAPLLGWPMTLARLLPALLVPPLLGLLGHWLFGVLQRSA